jgi:hypothetical protein
MRADNALNSADEHAQTSVSEQHGGCHSPRPAGGPDAAEAARPGLLELDAQPSAGRIRLSVGAAGKVSASVRRPCIPETCAASGPNREPGRILIPGDGAAGDQGLRIGCLPGNGGYATPAACPVSMTSWRYALRRTCRLVTGRSHRPRSAWPNQARPTLLAATHRYKRTHCLWLEQFQIAD